MLQITDQQLMTLEIDSQTASAPVTGTKAVDEIVRRAQTLYSLPAVAAEVIELTNNPKVDVQALKECIETDPALTVKVLRVVNSSLFGLSREVSDLNQAIALLGTKPLKLLVLGFSLPENLFAEVARDQLDWYWSTTIARAVAAREISEQLFNTPGDDAFLAGLLQDIGVLVLLSELKEPYALFLSGVIKKRVDLRRLEVDSLGFDHLQLTAALLEHWHMPSRLVRAIAEPRDVAHLVRSKEKHAELAKVIHLAELVAGLVGQNRLDVLPDLLETGRAYCGLEKEQLNELIGVLQPKVRQLAEVLSLDLVDQVDYLEIMTAAHQQMSELGQEVVALISQTPKSKGLECSELLDELSSLRKAVDGFLRQPSAGAVSGPASAVETAGSQVLSSVSISEAAGHGSADEGDDFLRKLTFAIGHCRSRRCPVSLICLELSGESSDNMRESRWLRQMLDAAIHAIDLEGVICESPSPSRRVLILPNFERRVAVRLAEDALESIERMANRITEKGNTLQFLASAGVSSLALPSKNFPPGDLYDTAKRCLLAAQTSGANVVKSLEIY